MQQSFAEHSTPESLEQVIPESALPDPAFAFSSSCIGPQTLLHESQALSAIPDYARRRVMRQSWRLRLLLLAPLLALQSSRVCGTITRTEGLAESGLWNFGFPAHHAARS
jgi:hypothetical protein